MCAEASTVLRAVAEDFFFVASVITINGRISETSRTKQSVGSSPGNQIPHQSACHSINYQQRNSTIRNRQTGNGVSSLNQWITIQRASDVSGAVAILEPTTLSSVNFQ
jgi:hypothetical protein